MNFFSNLFQKDYSDINEDKLNEIIKNNKKTLILDVRSEEEFNQGHILGAINIPVNDLSFELDDILSHKDNDVIIYCRSGVRSVTAAHILNDNGFTKIYNLSGGIMSYKGELK